MSQSDFYAPATPLLALSSLADGYRKLFELKFAPDTAAGGWQNDAIPSAGHCAAVSAILYHQLAVFAERFGGRVQCVSAIVNGGSHWFNRVELPDEAWDIDLTGDQFGLPPVQIAEAGTLYEGTRVRDFSELNEETLQRAALLARRAGLEVPFFQPSSQGRVPR